MRFLFTILFILLFLSTADAQQLLQSSLSVHSNFDTFYVVIDEDSSMMHKVRSEELVNLTAGEHTITVIPKYAPTFKFDVTFKADTVHKATVYFRNITPEPNREYLQLENGEEPYSNYTDLPSIRYLVGSFSISTWAKAEYAGRVREVPVDYEQTFIKVASNVDSLYVRPDANAPRTIRIASGDSVRVRPGIRKTIIGHQNAGEWSATFNYVAGTTTDIRHEFKLAEPSYETLLENIAAGEFYGANLIIISDSESNITVNGERAGRGAAGLQLDAGPVQILVENPLTGTHEYSAKVTDIPGDRAQVVDTYTRPVKNTARFLGFLPGISQFYKKQKLKGALFTGGFVILAGLAINDQFKYEKRLLDFNHLYYQYWRAPYEERALELGDALEPMQAEVARLDNRRLLMFGLTGLFYSLNLLDAIISEPKSGYRKETNLQLFMGSETIENRSYSSLSFRYAF